MNLPQYDIIHDETPYIYQFISEEGKLKVVPLQEIGFIEKESQGF